MKDSLMLKKYKTENVNGTFNLKEEKTFFGTKVMDIEDEIHIIDKSIQYFQVMKTGTPEEMRNNGYQFSQINQFEETLFIMDIVQIKNQHHNIKKTLQNQQDEKFNTRWEININIKNILIEYLFGKIKNARTFKSLSYKNFSSKNINKSIYEYINNNLLDRYEFSSIDLYIKYIDIKDNVIYTSEAIKQFDPLFNQSIEYPEYQVTNANMKLDLYLDKLAPITVNYYQTEPSSDFKFDYYYNIHYKKI